MTLTKDGLTRKEYRAKWYRENKERIQKKNSHANNPKRKAYKKEYYDHNKQRVANGLEPEGIRPRVYPTLSEEERKERRKEYESRPDVKERRKKYNSTEKYQAWLLEYNSRPEVKETRRQLARKKYADNREEKVAYGRKYRKENADRINAQGRERNKTAKRIAYRKARYQRLKAEGYYLQRKLEKK